MTQHAHPTSHAHEKKEAAEREVSNPAASEATLRDQLACSALASGMHWINLKSGEQIAEAAYKLADQLLVARAATTTTTTTTTTSTTTPVPETTTAAPTTTTEPPTTSRHRH